MSLKVWVGGITFKWGMRFLTKLPIYSLANDCGGAEGKGRGRGELSLVERHRHARRRWLIYWLPELTLCTFTYSQAGFGVRDRDFSTNLLTGGYMHRDFTGFPCSLCKALFRCGTYRHDLIGAADRGSVNSWAAAAAAYLSAGRCVCVSVWCMQPCVWAACIIN